MELPRNPEPYDKPYAYPGYVPPASESSTLGPGHSEIAPPSAADDATQSIETPATLESNYSKKRLTNNWSIVDSGRHSVSTQVREAIAQYVQEHPHIGTDLIEGEAREWTEIERDAIVRAGAAVVELAEDAGVDIQLSESSYHIMPTREAYIAAWQEVSSDATTGTVAFYHPFNGVIIDRTLNNRDTPSKPQRLWRAAVHETIHLGSKKIVLLGETAPNKAILVTEHNLTDDGLMVNLPNLPEAIAEMGTYNVIRRRHNVMNDVPELPAYPLQIIAADGLILDAAKFHGMDPAEIEQGLYRYNFGGEREGLHTFEQGVRPRRLAAFHELPAHPTLPDIQSARANGLFSLESDRKLSLWLTGRPVRALFEWQSSPLGQGPG